MRKVIVNNIASIDGRYADSSGNPLALRMDDAFDRANLESIEQADTILLGRNSFDGFSSYWPFVADAPHPEDPTAPEARAFDEINRAISRRYNLLPKVVVSDRGPIPHENAWHSSSKVIRRAEVLDWLEMERSGDGGSILLFASHVLWNSLLAASAIDELHLMVSPDPLGDGVPLFVEPARLELREARTFEDSSNIQLRYAVSR